MTTELEILGIVSSRLEQQGIAFMPTGSYAMAYYAAPLKHRAAELGVADLSNRVMS